MCTRYLQTKLLSLAVLAVSLLAGCKGDGLSDYDRMKKGQQDAADSLRAAGAKLREVPHPQGDSWAVGLSGLTITDELLVRLKGLGRITELDLSKSTITDDHMARLNEVEIGSVLRKLDLSNTAVTDAGLDNLTNLMILGDLNLSGTKVTAAGVERFRKRRQEDSRIMAMFKTPNIRK